MSKSFVSEQLGRLKQLLRKTNWEFQYLGLFSYIIAIFKEFCVTRFLFLLTMIFLFSNNPRQHPIDSMVLICKQLVVRQQALNIYCEVLNSF